MNFYSLFKQLTLAFFLTILTNGLLQAGKPFDDQPDETILHIATFVPPKDVLRSLVRVNKRFHSIMNDPQLWRHYYCQKMGITEIPHDLIDDPKGWKKSCISLIKNEQAIKIITSAVCNVCMKTTLFLGQFVTSSISSRIPDRTSMSTQEALEEEEANDLPPLEPSTPEEEDILGMDPSRLFWLNKLANSEDDSFLSSQKRFTQENSEDDDLPPQQNSTDPIQTLYSYLPGEDFWSEVIVKWLVMLVLCDSFGLL